MSKTLTQQLLAAIHDIEAGQARLESIQPMVNRLTETLEPSRQQFLREAVGNPEVDQDAIPQVLAAFERYRTGLDEVRGGLAGRVVTRVLEGAHILDEASTVLRTVRTTWESSLSQNGATPFPFVNRVLVHADYLANGGTDIQHALAALQDLPDFLTRLRRDIDTQEERVANPEALAQAQGAMELLRSAVEGLHATLTQWDRLPMLERQKLGLQSKERMMQAGVALTAALGSYLETDLSGPTPILLINLILRGFEGWARGASDAAAFSRTLQRAQPALSQMLFPLGGTPGAAAADRLKSLVDRIEAAAQEGSEEDVRVLLASLQDAAHEVAAVAGGMPDLDEEDEVVDFIEEQGRATRRIISNALPMNFQHLVDVARAYLGGQVSESDLATTLDQFDRTIVGTESRAAATPDAEHLLSPLKKGLDLLREASQTLRSLPEQRDRRVVDAAASLLSQATETLVEVGGMN
ncbi:MAG TPA: hypothetical protein VGO93_24700 [Candidatus Xenobia bacterium]|jgi:hypothetical protein